jgi:uncharacterized protein (UPF0264 family)
LVSVRHPREAETALGAGASVIDVKEPARGALGCADVSVWRSVVETVAGRVPVSVALGELRNWPRREPPERSVWDGITWRKMGLAGMEAVCGWVGRWVEARAGLGGSAGWIAVIYSDWPQADAPDPDRILDHAIETGCAGVLVDTFCKGVGRGLNREKVWKQRVELAKKSGLLVALAGGLDGDGIRRLNCLEPHLFAVRGAACRDGSRNSEIDAGRVAALAAAARGE